MPLGSRKGVNHVAQVTSKADLANLNQITRHQPSVCLTCLYFRSLGMSNNIAGKQAVARCSET